MRKIRPYPLVLMPAKADPPETSDTSGSSGFDGLVSALGSFAGAFGAQAATNFLAHNNQTVQRAPVAADPPGIGTWIKQNALLAGGLALGGVVVLVLALRRR